MAKKNRSRFTIPGVNTMRAEVGANPSSLANAANLSRSVVNGVLEEQKKPITTCEKVINGLKKLGHETASYADIVEHDLNN